MRISASGRYGYLLVALALLFAGRAMAEGAGLDKDQVSGYIPVQGEGRELIVQAGAPARELQLAAAIGIVKPEASEPVPPVAPAQQPAMEESAPSAGAAQASADTSDEAAAQGGGTSRTILIGAGVAALLGALAGGGGGGSSTPQH